jgi:hypothetical protein
VPSQFAQQAPSNSALRSYANHYEPALVLWCNALLREGSCGASWWGSLDGMQSDDRGWGQVTCSALNAIVEVNTYGSPISCSMNTWRWIWVAVRVKLWPESGRVPMVPPC